MSADSSMHSMVDESTRRVNPNVVEVLHQSPHYIVINKPPHCVMDDNHDCTVEQLVQRFLVNKSRQKSQTEIEHSRSDDNNNSPPKMYWVHQLDAETSGVLCIGLSSKAAAAASKLLATRQTKKEYVSVVHGHICSLPQHRQAPQWLPLGM